jgi:hypothetical protein
MSFTYRPTKLLDLKRCLALSGNRGAYDSVAEEDVVAFWGSLLSSRAALSRVVETQTAASGRQVIGFGLSVFVTDEFMAEITTTLPPNVGWQMFLRWRLGQRMFLTREEFAQKNNPQDGLNLMVLAYGTAVAELRTEDENRVRSRMFEAFIECHAGYCVKVFHQEMFSLEDKVGGAGLGLKVVRDFGDAVYVAAGPSLPATALMGLHRDSFGFPGQNAMLWPFFHPPAPRCQFTNLEKDVLDAALHSDTDEEIAGALNISIWTVKKRWQRIYEKSERVFPDLLQSDPDGGPGSEGLSGQRRRHLLDYLRQHLEEIRPTAEERRATPGRRR